MHNATTEGGHRNGVMTAVDDFVAEYDRPVRRVLIPIYFGLAIVVDAAPCSTPSPSSSSGWTGWKARRAAVSCSSSSESIRLQALTAAPQPLLPTQPGRTGEPPLPRPVEGRVARRALHGERGSHRPSRSPPRWPAHNQRPTPSATRCARSKDKTRQMLAARRRRQARRRSRAGHSATSRTRRWAGFASTTSSGVSTTFETERVAGDLVECGTGRGGGGVFLRGYTAAWEMNDRRVWIADTFRASPSLSDDLPETTQSRGRDARRWPWPSRPSRRPQHRSRRVQAVRPVRQPPALPARRVRDTLPSAESSRSPCFAWATTSTTRAATSSRRSTTGSRRVGSSSSKTSCRRRRRSRSRTFAHRRGHRRPDRAGRLVRRVLAQVRGALGATSTGPTGRPARAHAPLARRRADPTKDLSVVVVFYNMRARRSAPCTRCHAPTRRASTTSTTR